MRDILFPLEAQYNTAISWDINDEFTYEYHALGNAALGTGSSLSQVGLISCASRVGTSLFVIPTSTSNRDTWGMIADATKLSLEAREQSQQTWQRFKILRTQEDEA